MEQDSFGNWLKRKRKALDLTQAELGDQVGCSAAAIRKIEAEERRPSREIVERLGQIFQVPSTEQASFLRFARGELRFAPAETEADFPWHTSERSARSNIPATLTSLIGREQDIALIREHLSSPNIRLLSLVGPPGIGKTRLSIEAARAVLADFPDGVFFVALAPLDDPSLLVPSVIQVIGYVETRNTSANQQLVNGIADKQMLIVLDNCEHLIENIAALVPDLLLACPHLKILATSRESLRVPGEWLYSIAALNVPKGSSSVDIETVLEFPALLLFGERARAVNSDFALHIDNIQAVASICAQLDGLPLAIELMAARMRLMTPQALLEHLNGQFVLSANGMRSLSTRQKTLNDAIAWSYNLLSEEEQKLVAYLSVFSGSFTIEAVEKIFSKVFVGKSASSLLALLLDKSLLQRTFDVDGDTRFHMLVTIRQFALDRLQSLGKEVATRTEHLSYFLEFAEQAKLEIHGPSQILWMRRLDKELDNLRAALDWGLANGQTGKVLQLFAALSWNWLVRWSPSEYRSWLTSIRALPDLARHPVSYAEILNIAAQQEWLAAHFGKARSLIEESQAIWLGLGVQGERGLAETLCWLGMLARERSSEKDYTIAADYFEQSFQLYEKCGDRWGMAFSRLLSGTIAIETDEADLALLWLDQSWVLFSELDDPWGIARIAQRLGELYMRQGSYEKARVLFDQHLQLDETLNFKEGIAVALINLGQLSRHQRDYDLAESYFKKSLSICHEYSLKIDRGINLYAPGLLALHRNQYSLARQFFIDYFYASHSLTEHMSACDFLMGAAAVAGAANQPERAARLFGAVQAVFEMTAYRIPPFDLAELDRHIQTARVQLGEERFMALAAEGRAMTMEQAIEYALEWSTAPRS